MEVDKRRDWNVDDIFLFEYERKKNTRLRSQVNWLGRAFPLFVFLVFRETQTTEIHVIICHNRLLWTGAEITKRPRCTAHPQPQQGGQVITRRVPINNLFRSLSKHTVHIQYPDTQRHTNHCGWWSCNLQAVGRGSRENTEYPGASLDTCTCVFFYECVCLWLWIFKGVAEAVELQTWSERNGLTKPH